MCIAIVLSRQQTTGTLVRFADVQAGLFLILANGKNRFSYDVAQLMIIMLII